MEYRDLRDFIDQLEQAGDLKRIRQRVDPNLEVTEISDRVLRAGGPALLFEQAGDSKIPLLANLFGTEKRVAQALGAEQVTALREIDDFDISVAAYPEVHPQARSEIDDLRHLQRKLDAGAARAITQYFFEADCFLRFRDRAAAIGVDKPLVPGILPVHDIDKVIAFSQLCGASVPRRYVEAFARVGDDEAARYQLSLELAVGLCQRLLDEGVEQIHLYTLNQTDLCLDISLALGASLKGRRFCPAA